VDQVMTLKSRYLPEPVPSQLTLAGVLRPHWKPFLFAFVAVIGETLADVAAPWPVKIVLDNVLQQKKLGWLAPIVFRYFGDNTIAILNFAVAAVIVIAIVGAISSYTEKVLTTTVSQWVAHDLRRTLYQHIQRLSLAEHNDARKGDLIARVTSDIDAVQDFISQALLGIILNLLTLVGMVSLMFYVDWRFTLIALSIMPALFLVVFFYAKKIKRASRRVRKQESELLSGLAEVFAAVQVVQAFAREDYEERRFDFDSRQSVEAGLQARSMKARLSPMIDLVAALGTCLVLGYGARVVLAGHLSAGTLVVFLLYLTQMYKPLRDLSKMTNTISKAAVGYERMKEVLEIESKVRDSADATRAPAFKGGIEFDRVTFGYGDDFQVLKDVSLRIEAGQVAAFVGPSGTGKSTIVSLIPRFYDPQGGRVLVDGVDVRNYTLKSLRDQISFVLQDTQLFRATIWENIAYGRPDAQPEDTIRAAELANAHDFITNLPQGYGTLVGDRGTSLSGGQRQRIAIARAIVRNTPILVLDEPTSGLDADSERAVVQGLRHLMKGRTCLIVAHHLSTIRHADVIFVVRDSQLAESGTHDQLVARGGFYANLWDLQTGGGHRRRKTDSPIAAT
jgi:subfamily B ATP-binding cassette protein MsbA